MRNLFVRLLAQPLYDLQRRIRPSMRQAIRARDRGLAFRAEAWGWSPERKEAWILDRLRMTVSAANSTPFYRDYFKNVGFDPEALFSFDDFAQLPVLERSMVRENLSSLRMPYLDRRQVRRDSTGGATGEPTVVLKGPEERGWGESASEFFATRIGCPPGVRTAFLWGHHLDPVASDRWMDRIRTFVSNARWYDCFRVSSDTLGSYHEDLQSWRPTYLVAYASALAALADSVADSPDPIRYPVKCFVTGAEKLLPEDRRKIETVFGRPVYERYGSRDVGLIAFQSIIPGSTRFEVDWPNTFVEPETEAEQASVLITKLHGDGMPMIRYRIGDLAKFPQDISPGHPAFWLEEVVGREVDRLWLPNGQWFNALGVPHLMKDYSIVDFQIEQAADFSLTVRFVPGTSYSDAEGQSILKILRANLPGLPISLEPCSVIERGPSGKRRLVQSHVRPPAESDTR